MRKLLFIVLVVVFVSNMNAMAAEIKIENADAVFETSLQSVSIPTQAAKLSQFFINREDTVLTNDLSSVSIPTQAVQLTRLFIVNADAILTKGLVPRGEQPPVPPTISSFTLSLDEGVNMISLPLKQETPLSARSFAEKLGATTVIRYNTEQDKFTPFVPEVFEGDGFPIEGGQGYIVNLLKSKEVVFKGTAWSNAPSKSILASPAKENSHWAFVVCGVIRKGNRIAQNPNLTVTAENLSTGEVAEAGVGQLETGRYTASFVDLGRKDVVEIGDYLEVYFRDTAKGIASEPVIHTVKTLDIVKSYIEVNLRIEDLFPKETALLQNYPNPFNPETWIPFQLTGEADVLIKIYDISGNLIKTFELGKRSAGFYISKERAVHWDGKNDAGEKVSSGVYFYQINAGDFIATKKLVILK